ncbi:MAG: cytochrome c family protein [Pseudomonadota bacterium]|nr:cytochrome c family protein [Pseudomonadota bacterium]
MAAIFKPQANVASKFSLIGAALAVVLGVGWWWGFPRTNYSRSEFWTVQQPVPFSHEHHVNGLGIDCRMCHTSVATSSNAGLPPTHTCMTCHSQIWTNAAILEPVRQSLANDKPIAWNRVYDLPDYVFFAHNIHIAKGVGCASCHGQINHMPLTYKAVDLEMTFCIDCHQNPGPRLRPKSEIYNMDWKRTPATPSPAQLMADNHVRAGGILLDCSTCHR